MYTPIYNEFFQRNSCNFSADRVKTRQYHRFWCIINNQINACQCFQCTNISTLTSNDTPLHFVVGQLYHRHSCFRHMVHGTSLNSICNNFSGTSIRFHFCLAFNLFNHQCCFMFDISFHHSQNLIFGIFCCQTRNTFQFL